MTQRLRDCDTSSKWVLGFHSYESSDLSSRCKCGEKTLEDSIQVMRKMGINPEVPGVTTEEK